MFDRPEGSRAGSEDVQIQSLTELTKLACRFLSVASLVCLFESLRLSFSFVRFACLPLSVTLCFSVSVRQFGCRSVISHIACLPLSACSISATSLVFLSQPARLSSLVFLSQPVLYQPHRLSFSLSLFYISHIACVSLSACPVVVVVACLPLSACSISATSLVFLSQPVLYRPRRLSSSLSLFYISHIACLSLSACSISATSLVFLSQPPRLSFSPTSVEQKLEKRSTHTRTCTR